MSGTRRSSLSLSHAPSFSLSFGCGSPIAKQRARRRERSKEKTDGERRDKRRDRDAYNYLSFYVLRTREGPASPSFFFRLPRSLAYLLDAPSFFPIFPPLLSLSSTLLATSRARFPSFLFLFFLAFSPLLLMVGASDAFAYERARDEREHERTDRRTDGHARMHTGKPKRSARE